MARHAFSIFVALVLALSFTSSAWAFTVFPTYLELSPQGRGSSGRVYIRNTSVNKVPIDVSLRVFDPTAVESQGAPAQDVQFFPPQLLMAQNETDFIQISYQGDAVQSSKLYYLALEQVRLVQDVEQPDRSISVKYVFRIPIIVAPDGARPDLSVDDARINERTGELILIVRNAGARHALPSHARWVIATEEGEIVVPEDLVRGMTAPVFVPGEVVQFSLPIEVLDLQSRVRGVSIQPLSNAVE